MSRSYKKYKDDDKNVKGVNLTFASNSSIISDGSKYIIDKAKGIISKGALQTQLSSLYFQLGKMVYYDYENETDNSKEIKRCIKQIKNIKDEMRK